MKGKAKKPGKQRGRKPGNAVFTEILQGAVTPETKALLDRFLVDNPRWNVSMFVRYAVVTALESDGYKHKGETTTPQP